MTGEKTNTTKVNFQLYTKAIVNENITSMADSIRRPSEVPQNVFTLFASDVNINDRIPGLFSGLSCQAISLKQYIYINREIFVRNKYRVI